MKTISRIAYSNDKKNKTRSILIMMAICLTTMLLVIISTVGNGVIHLQKSQAAGSYGSNYGLFVAADASQLKEVERRAEISDIGIMCTAVSYTHLDVYKRQNKVSLLKITVDSSKCVGCGQCAKACKMDVDVCKTPDHPECIDVYKRQIPFLGQPACKRLSS